MQRIVIKLSRQVKRQFRRTIRKTKDAKLKTRYLIILHTAEGYSRRNIAKMLLCFPSIVDRVRKRFGEEGDLGLIDQRGDNGSAKVNEDYILALIKAVERTPLHYGYHCTCQGLTGPCDIISIFLKIKYLHHQPLR